MRGERRWYDSLGLKALYWALVLYLFLPILVMVLMGFKDSRFIGFPIRHFTLKWYGTVLQDTEIMGAFGYSVIIAVVSTILSLLIGLNIGVFLGRVTFWGRGIAFGLMLLPAVIPGIISGISLRLFIKLLAIEPGTLALILGHTIHNVPFVAIMILSRLKAMNPSLEEAAMDLGADELITFCRVTLPFLKPALVGATVFSLLISFDDFIRSYFLAGYSLTLPVLIFAKLRFGMSPEINAISTLVLLITVTAGLVTERFLRRR
ncbi:MAG: ABC transporter permease [Nitrospinota bacterium]|nr:MAG: ABC transporter permease [Nitrospinota bacterium]